MGRLAADCVVGGQWPIRSWQNRADTCRGAATYGDKIPRVPVRGGLPTVQLAKFKLVLNLIAARR